MADLFENVDAAKAAETEDPFVMTDAEFQSIRERIRLFGDKVLATGKVDAQEVDYLTLEIEEVIAADIVQAL